MARLVIWVSGYKAQQLVVVAVAVTVAVAVAIAVAIAFAVVAGDGSSSDAVEILCPQRASSIGNKYICALTAPMTIASLSLQVTEAVGGTPAIDQFSAFRCAGVAAAIDARWARRPRLRSGGTA